MAAAVATPILIELRSIDTHHVDQRGHVRRHRLRRLLRKAPHQQRGDTGHVLTYQAAHLRQYRLDHPFRQH